jgi:hypothetical protein
MQGGVTLWYNETPALRIPTRDGSAIRHYSRGIRYGATQRVSSAEINRDLLLHHRGRSLIRHGHGRATHLLELVQIWKLESARRVNKRR